MPGSCNCRYLHVIPGTGSDTPSTTTMDNKDLQPTFLRRQQRRKRFFLLVAHVLRQGTVDRVAHVVHIPESNIEKKR